nr:MAG TPA: hypothetical protein [Caudoviricetes sp.]
MKNLVRIFGKGFLETGKRIFTCKTGTPGGIEFFPICFQVVSALTFIQLYDTIITYLSNFFIWFCGCTQG